MSRSDFTKFLDTIIDEPDGDIARAQPSLEEVAAEAADYRRGTKRERESQDHHLEEWIAVYRAHEKLGREQPDYEVREQLFAHDMDEIMKSAVMYITWAAEHLRPVRNDDEFIKIGTLQSRITSIWYWIWRETDVEPSRKQRQILENAMIVAGKKFGINTKAREDQVFLGRYELAQLLQFDTQRCVRLDVWENHHVAWTLACLCGVRPGSLGTARGGPRDDKLYPTWEDVKFTRGPIPGSFNLDIKFRVLKGENGPDDLGEQVTLDFKIMCPAHSDHLPISPAHRLLVMALRRKLLKDHKDLDSLLSGVEYTVQVKPEKAHEPLLLAGRGQGLPSKSLPLTAKNIAERFQHVAQDGGYGTNVTLYGWRKKTATETLRAVGADRARRALNHKRGTTTLEEHYEQGNFDLPVMEIALGGNIQRAQRQMADISSPALTRFADQSALPARIEELCEELRQTDEEYLRAVQENDRPKIKVAGSRIRRSARDLAYKEGEKASKEALTVHDVYARKKELHDSGNFMRMVREKYGGVQLPVTVEEDNDMYDFRDAEELQPNAGGQFQLNVDDPNNTRSEPAEFLQSAKTLMQFLLLVTVSPEARRPVSERDPAAERLALTRDNESRRSRNAQIQSMHQDRETPNTEANTGTDSEDQDAPRDFSDESTPSAVCDVHVWPAEEGNDDQFDPEMLEELYGDDVYQEEDWSLDEDQYDGSFTDA